MNKADRQELAKILYGLAGNFGDTLNEYAMELWVNCFDDDGITLREIRKAAIHILKTRTIAKMPTYAEFVECIHGSLKDQAAIQADEVLKQVRIHGANSTPFFKDQTTMYLMATVWPWRNFAGSLLEKNIPFWRRDFIEAYRTYSTASTRNQIEIEFSPKLKQLTGRIGQ